jgi:hypothetical protein
MCDPIRGVAGKATLEGQRLGAPEPWWLGLSSSYARALVAQGVVFL